MSNRFVAFCLTSATACLMVVATRAAETEQAVSLEQVPAAVRTTIEKHAENASIVEIEVSAEKKAAVYEVKIKKAGQTQEFLVASDGKYLGEETDKDEAQEKAPKHKGQAKPASKLPKQVAKTFKTAFPQGKIAKVEAEQENGVTVYDIEFTEGKTEKETDIAGDGTLLEFSTAIDVKAVPEAALQAVRQAAEGAKIDGAEQVEMSHQAQDGKVVKLPQPATLYEIKLTKRDQVAEIVVATDGTLVEPAKWAARKGDGEHEEDEK